MTILLMNLMVGFLWDSACSKSAIKALELFAHWFLILDLFYCQDFYVYQIVYLLNVFVGDIFLKTCKTSNFSHLFVLPWGHPLSAYAKFSEKVIFLTPWYAHVRVRIRGLEMLIFRKMLRTYLMDDPRVYFYMLMSFHIITLIVASGIAYVNYMEEIKTCYFANDVLFNASYQNVFTKVGLAVDDIKGVLDQAVLTRVAMQVIMRSGFFAYF